MTLSASPAGLNSLCFDGQKHAPDPSVWPSDPDHPVLQQTVQWLDLYFRGRVRPFDAPLDLSGGSAFQQAVWQALLAIAPGHTCSYGALATALGRPGAARAVGAAVGQNPISLIVPCHRVIGANAQLTGYAGGLDRKAWLLQLEGVR
jgi:methylated-DNA-[protein]-cysteine S-methyltransferase